MFVKDITFIGSIDTSYKRGKDKTKRKSRGLLASVGVLASAGIGARMGSMREQSNIYVKNSNKKFNKKGIKFPQGVLQREALEEVKRIRSYQPPSNAPKFLKDKFIKRKGRIIKLLNKARLRGGLKGAAIGAGLGLGAVYLSNKLKNKDKN